MSKQDTSDEPKAAKDGNTRWWESYLVRYFIGFIFGAICISIIALHFGKAIASGIPSAIEIKSSGVLIAISLLGVGYCYIASSPITVMHHGRFSRNWVDGQSRYFWLGLLISLVFFALSNAFSWVFLFPGIGLLIGIVLIVLLPVKKHAYLKNLTLPLTGSWNACVQTKWNKFKNYQDFCFDYQRCVMLFHTVAWALLIVSLQTMLRPLSDDRAYNITTCFWLLAAPVFWVGLAQYSVIFKIILLDRELFIFYSKLFSARRHKNARDVRDTYTHLREHSNSVFIVTLELAILALVFALGADSGSVKDYREVIVYVVAGLFFWMLPTVFLWSRANAMEYQFSLQKGDFLEDIARAPEDGAEQVSVPAPAAPFAETK